MLAGGAAPVTVPPAVDDAHTTDVVATLVVETMAVELWNGPGVDVTFRPIPVDRGIEVTHDVLVVLATELVDEVVLVVEVVGSGFFVAVNPKLAVKAASMLEITLPVSTAAPIPDGTSVPSVPGWKAAS